TAASASPASPPGSARYPQYARLFPGGDHPLVTILERHRPLANIQDRSEIHVEVDAARRCPFDRAAMQPPDRQWPGGGGPVQDSAARQPVPVGEEEVLERERR